MKTQRLLDTHDGLLPFLQLTVDSAVELLGFDYCAIRLRLGAASHQIVESGQTSVVLAGPRTDLSNEEQTDQWTVGGEPRAEVPAGASVIGELLTDETGRAIGVLVAVTDPGTPSPTAPKLDQLRDQARHAETAIRVSLSLRHEMDQIRVSDTSRAAVRSLAASADVVTAWPQILDLLKTAFEADFATMLSINSDGSSHLVGGSANAESQTPQAQEFLTAVARKAWKDRTARVYTPLTVDMSTIPPVMHGVIQRWAEAGLIQHTLFVPIGAGEECLGALVIGRQSAELEWTENETSGATALGADLGAVLFTRRTLAAQGRYLAELQFLDQYQDDLLNTVTELLRAPLADIDTQLDLLSSGANPDPARIADIEHDVTAMARLVDDLLFFSRVTDPRRSREAELLNVASLARQAADRVFPMADGLSVRVRSSGAFPMVRGDETELLQLFTNVIQNAVQYTASGSVSVTVSSGVSEADITVRDTGPGIPENEQARVFDEFYRGSSARGIPGSGLGLTIAARVVAGHGGRIALASDDEGTVVRICLPLAQ